MKMDLRKINATERARIYEKFTVIILIMFFVILIIVSLISSTIKHDLKPSLSNYSCEEIYNMSINGKFSSGKYSADSIVLYYMENCQNINKTQI